MSEYGLRFDVEDVSMYLSCAIKNLRTLKNEMEGDLLAQNETSIYLGPDHLLDCCDAMCTVLRELDRLNEELDAIVTAMYQKKKGQ